MQIMNAAISSMGMHGGVSSQGGTGNADNSNSVSSIHMSYFLSTSHSIRLLLLDRCFHAVS